MTEESWNEIGWDHVIGEESRRSTFDPQFSNAVQNLEPMLRTLEKRMINL